MWIANPNPKTNPSPNANSNPEPDTSPNPNPNPKEEAVRLAVASEEWAAAFLIARSMGEGGDSSHWNNVVNQYAASKFGA